MPKDGNRQKFANPDGRGGEGGAIDNDAEQPSDANGGADGGDGGDNTEPGDGEGTGGGGTPRTYTDDDVDSIVTSRLARERAKLERQIRESIAKEQEDERTEAEKLANMTELERAKYEAKKLKEEKAALEAERDFSQQMAIARRELADANIHLGDELLEMFVSPDAEKTAKALEKLKELFPKVVNEGVQQKLKRSVPPAEKEPAEVSYGASYADKYNKKMNGGK